MSGIDLVAVGCSWGGLAAVQQVLAHLPARTDAALVVVQHRSERINSFVDLLSPDSPWPVREPDDKEPIVPMTVYIAPPAYHLLVDAERFSLSTEGPVHFSRPSIDALFSSAAWAFRSRLAAVVLTGANEDGAAGAADVAAMGGTVLVQDPASAERGEMPAAALAAVPTARVLSLPAIGAALAELAGVDAVA